MDQNIKTDLSTDWVEAYSFVQEGQSYFLIKRMQDKIGNLSRTSYADVIERSHYTDHEKEWLRNYFGKQKFK